jgi:hypothetical protein
VLGVERATPSRCGRVCLRTDRPNGTTAATEERGGVMQRWGGGGDTDLGGAVRVVGDGYG